MFYKKIKKYFVFFFLLALFFSISSKAFAQEKFSTDYHITYTIREDTSANVNIKVSLTNKTAEYYASSYKINVGIQDVYSVTAKDSGGAISPTVIKGDKGANIELAFNKRTVGLNNKQDFEINFLTHDIAKKLGRITEINIPGMSKDNEVSSFNVSVVVPQSFGKPSYVKPNVLAYRDLGNGQASYTSAQNLEDAGIYMAFGDYQIFSFNIVYHLKNTDLYPVKTEIALPPDTNYQEVIFEDISEKPENVYIDSNGNWLAEYSLLPQAKKDIVLKGKVKINLEPKKENLSPEQFTQLTAQKPYWEAGNEQIKHLAGLLKTPEAIYDYVVRNLSYDFDRVTREDPRLGASEVLNNPSSAVCLEFTDLFIALARAAGIPAREVDGYAYSQNETERPLSLQKDILHAWPEYYDQEKGTWIMVDPTWGNTTGGIDYFSTLDFDHFAFVIKGLNSSYPVPPGGDRDITVEFANDFPSEINDFDVKFETSLNVLPWKKSTGELIVTNKGNGLYSFGNLKLSIPSEELNREIEVGSVPPYGAITLPIELARPTLRPNSDIIIASLEGKEFRFYAPSLPIKFLAAGGAIIIGLAILSAFIFWKITRKSRNISIQGQEAEDSLRRQSKKP